MAGESAMNTEPGQAGSPIDELIRAILQEAGTSPEAYAPSRVSPASLLEAAFASTLASPNSSALERVLIAQAFGSALARTVAQELAESPTPRLMKQAEQVLTKHLEQVMASQSSGRAETAQLRLIRLDQAESLTRGDHSTRDVRAPTRHQPRLIRSLRIGRGLNWGTPTLGRRAFPGRQCPPGRHKRGRQRLE